MGNPDGLCTDLDPSQYLRRTSRTGGALDNVEALISLPRVRAIGEGDGFLPAYRQATEGVVVRGNLVPDAHLATLLRQHGVRRLYTNDADFRKFPFMEVRDPFS